MKKRTKKRKKRGGRKKTQAVSIPNSVSQSNTESVLVEQQTMPKPYPTIPKREFEKRGRDERSVFKVFNVVSQFLRESKAELKKVKWPTRKELLASTAMVIFLVLVVAFFLWVIDLGLLKIITHIVG